MSSKYIPPANLKISERPKEPRAMDAIQQDYTQLCVKLGNLEYQLKSLEVEKGVVVQKMSEVSLEASMIKKEDPIPNEGATNG